MMFPMPPPDDDYQRTRNLRNGSGSPRKGRHISSLDLHELVNDQEALRPDPIWMAIHRLVEMGKRLPIVQRFQGWRERLSQHRHEPSEPTIAERNACSKEDVIPAGEHVVSGS